MLNGTARRKPPTMTSPAPSRNAERSTAQREIVEKERRESCLDRSIRLGFPPEQYRTEFGPTIRQYYQAKFKRGVQPSFWLHHTVDQRTA